MSTPVIRANVLPTPPLAVHLELTDTEGRKREKTLEAELLTFNHIWDPAREIDIAEDDPKERALANALIFLRQLTPESWAWLSEATGCKTHKAGVDWLAGNPVGTGAFQEVVELADRLTELSHPEASEEKKKRFGSLRGTMFWCILLNASGWILAASALGLPGKLLRYITSLG